MRHRWFSHVLAAGLLSCCLSRAVQLVECEYFFNTDPGIGAGTPLALPAGSEVDTTLNIPTAGLPRGWHFLFIRVRDDENTWSLYEGRRFYINTPEEPRPDTSLAEAEYFFNADPGLGNGMPMALPAADQADVQHEVPATGLEPGWHSLSVRVRNDQGAWCLFEVRRFFVQFPADPLPPTELAQLEFFVNIEPGVGAGTPVAIPAGALFDDTVQLDMTGVPEGTHTVYLRVLDGRGGWSFRDAGTFEVTDIEFHWVTFSADEHGSIEGPAVQHVPDASDSTAVTAVPECDCYVFAGWTGDYTAGPEENPLVIPNVTGPLNITATFELLYIYDQDDLDQAVANAPGPDRDGDGVTDEQEVLQGTDPDSYVVILEPGWNLISFARIPPDNSVFAMFQGATEGPAWAWNTGRRSYYPETHVWPTKGLWVYSFHYLEIRIVVPNTVVVTTVNPPRAAAE